MNTGQIKSSTLTLFSRIKARVCADCRARRNRVLGNAACALGFIGWLLRVCYKIAPKRKGPQGVSAWMPLQTPDASLGYGSDAAGTKRSRRLNQVDTYAFSSMWFWALLVLIWTLITSRVMGLPYYYWKLGKNAEADVQARMMDATLLQAQVALSYSEIRYPNLSMGAVSFVIALWGVSGFLYDHELLQATFLLFVPLLSVVPLRLWLARKLDGAEFTYETYYGLITRYRRLCLMVAAFTIFLSTFWGMIYNLAHANILT
jgi:hypothetical protein